MKKFFLIIILYSCCISLYAQNISEEKITQWNGFEKVSFKMDSVAAFYIKPEKAIAGNPWIWRAHFPTWHTQMDSILLERGFYIAYINTNNLFGHYKAMMVWDQFYNYLVSKKHFASKVALEAVSRGGLYAYSWAKRNPSKVNCIYAEAPVCDFISWPGGKGKGKGSPDDWKKLLEVYGFTDGQALQYKDQPKDNLESLASYKVPILHVVGLKDSLVPYSENSEVLINNYIRLGGPATVVPMTKGKIELSGHHFPIEDPEALAGFIYKNSVPVKDILKSEEFIHSYGNLNNFLYAIQNNPGVTVAFLGGSITNMHGWRNKVETYLQELFPETKFTFINAGIPSLGSVPHAFRLQNDVLNKGKIDLLFIESAVNDFVNGATETQQRRALEGIIRHAYSSNHAMNMVMMAFADEDKIADYKEGEIPVEIKVHDDLARHYHLPFINLAEEVSRRIFHKEFTWEDDFKNLHPAPFGQEIYFATIKKMFQNELIDKSSTKLLIAPLPSPLQKNAYTNGVYVPVNKASFKNGFIIKNSWKPKDDVHTRAGFVNVPVLLAENPGAEIEFTFKGTAVGIAVVAGPDAGIIIYSIDGKKEQSADLFTKWSRNLHLPWYILLGDDLSKGKHRLKIKIAENHNAGSKGTACRIVHFLVNKNTL
jgi:sialidase-1